MGVQKYSLGEITKKTSYFQNKTYWWKKTGKGYTPRKNVWTAS